MENDTKNRGLKFIIMALVLVIIVLVVGGVVLYNTLNEKISDANNEKKLAQEKLQQAETKIETVKNTINEIKLKIILY